MSSVALFLNGECIDLKKINTEFKRGNTLRSIVANNSIVRSEKVYFKYFDKDRQVVTMTYGEFGQKVENMIGSLAKNGFEGKRIALIGETSPEWIISFFAIVSAGAVVIPLDRELLHDQIKGFLVQAKADAIVMSPKYSEKYEELKNDGVFDSLEKVIRVDDGTEWVNDDEKLCKFSEFIAQDDGNALESTSEIFRKTPRGDMSIMLFTSGTTGSSKCVMLSERNIVACANSAVESVNFCEEDVLMSVLPIHHTYELACIIAETTLGITICINDNLKYILKNLNIFKPTGLVLVPLFVSTFDKKIREEVKKKGKQNQLKMGMIASNAMRFVGIDVREKLFSEVLSAFGGNLKKIICGGAAMDPSLSKTFESFGINLCEGYGITECSPLIAVNPYYRKKLGSVGPAVPCCEVRIDAQDKTEKGYLSGEIQVKGENVMLGYYENKQANIDAFTDDGWFRTGDIGYMDNDGYIYITGRQKSVIVLNNGKNVFPEEIEEYLAKIENICEAVVVGRKKESSDEVVLTALVYPDFTKYASDTDINEIAADIKQKVLLLNKKLPSFKQIRNIEIRKNEFEKTSSRKIKRFLVK